MPEDHNSTQKRPLGPNAKREADLESGALDSSPLPSPMPSIEQEPQTSSATPRMTSSAFATPASGMPTNASPATSFSTEQPAQGGSGKSGGKKKWIIGGTIAAALVLIFGGGALAYFVYQSPDKVIADGFVNVFQSQPRSVKGDMSLENNEASVKATVDIKSNDKIANGSLTMAVTIKTLKQTFNGKVDFAATADGNGYIKVNGIDALADQYADVVIRAQEQQYKAYGMTITESQKKELRKQLLAQTEPIIQKINNRWIKFDTKANDDTSEQQKCITDAFKKLQSDKGMRDELAKAYGDNKFVNVKEQLGVKDGSYGYVLDFDSTKAKSFGDAAEKTSFFKELQKCDGFSSNSSSTDAIKDDNNDNVRVELWVSQWSHQITALNIEGTDTSTPSDETKISFKLNLGYTKDDNVTEPKGAVDFMDLQKEFEQLDLMGTGSTTSSSVSI